MLLACAGDAAPADGGADEAGRPDAHVPDGALADGAPDDAELGDAGEAPDAGPCCGERIVHAGRITEDEVWRGGDTHVLEGVVRVLDAVLTIEAGARIESYGRFSGENALIVAPDARLEARGTRDAPIVFASARPEGEARAGDWGGIVLFGRAPINQAGGEGTLDAVPGLDGLITYGGSDPAHDCGALRYVRIEHVGGVTTCATGCQLPGVLLAGCGRGTEVDYVQVTAGSGDGFQIFGGGFDATHLVASDVGDDGIQIREGFQGSLQFVVVRADGAMNHGLELDNNEERPTATPQSFPRFWNTTIIGRDADDSSGVEVAEGTAATLGLSLVASFSKTECVDADDRDQEEALARGDVTLRDDVFAGCGVNVLEASEAFDPFDPAFRNRFDVRGDFLMAPSDPAAPDFRASGTVDLSTEARPEGLPAGDPDFDPDPGFVGAMEDEDWTAGWTAYPDPWPPGGP